MAGIVLTFPVLPEKVEAWRRFCQEMAGSRSDTHKASRVRLGITRERMMLLETPFGSAATTTLEAPDIGRMLSKLLASDWPFDIWYRARIEDLHGVGLTGYKDFAELGEPTLARELLFEWSVHDSPGT